MAWKWTPQRTLAAQLVAEDLRKDEQIAELCGVAIRTLYLWKAEAEFDSRVDTLRTWAEDAAEESWIARRKGRLAKLEKRADDLAIRIKEGEDGGRDLAALIREERALMEQAAKELGQWKERVEHTGSGDSGAVSVELSGASGRLAELLDSARTRRAEDSSGSSDSS